MASLTRGIFIVGAKRTPFGTYGGKLAKRTPTDLQEVASKAALAAANLKTENVDSVVIGNVSSSSNPDTPYIARHVAIRLGLPIDTPCLVVNRLCGSGFQAIVTGCHDILMGDSKVVLTGGSENMSAAPFALRDARFGTKLGVDLKLEDMLWATLSDLQIKTPMGVTAENLAEKYNVTRQESDEFSIRSQVNWAKAQKAGIFDDEMCPVQIKTRKGVEEMTVDEHPKPNATLEALAKLPTVFKKGGIVTAGSSSGICDGASSVIIASEEACKELNLTPLARVVGYGIAGVDPHIMGIGPAPAIRKVLKVANMSLDDIGMVEINEAFSAQTVSCAKDLKLNPDILNMNGGAIALGHPVGASGSRISAHMAHFMRRSNIKYGIGSACIGGGQGIAVLLEKM